MSEGILTIVVAFSISTWVGVLFVFGFASFNIWNSRKNLMGKDDFNVDELNELLAASRSGDEDVDSTTMKESAENISDRDERISKLMEKYSHNSSL